MQLRIVVSRHSAFYSPLIATVAEIDATYEVLQPGQRSQELIRDGVADIMQSAVSSNWKPLERGESPLPVHFALINRRDGFYLAGRDRNEAFAWKNLEGKTLLADHGAQPLAMLRYAAHHNGVDWSKIRVLDRGDPERMSDAFRRGEGDYVHLQAPGPQLLEHDAAAWTLTSVGASMPEVAFSTLCCSREFVNSDDLKCFLIVYRRSREWVRTAPTAEVTAKIAGFFPGVALAELESAIAHYQRLGNWEGDIAITPELYDQALNVFEHSGAVERRHPWPLVCTGVPTIVNKAC